MGILLIGALILQEVQTVAFLYRNKVTPEIKFLGGVEALAALGCKVH